MRSLGIGVKPEVFDDDKIAAVKVAASAVGYRVAETLTHGAAGFVGRELQTLGLDGKVLAAVFFTEPAAALGKLVAYAAPVCDILKGL